MRRKTLFYTVNMIFPTVAISYLTGLVFYLPADSGEKLSLCISILLSQTMFFVLISEIIPPTSLAVPLLSRYVLFTMFLVGISVFLTTVILNIHYRNPNTHRMASWVRKLFINFLPKFLFMEIPSSDSDSDKSSATVSPEGSLGSRRSSYNENGFPFDMDDEVEVLHGDSGGTAAREFEVIDDLPLPPPPPYPTRRSSHYKLPDTGTNYTKQQEEKENQRYHPKIRKALRDVVFIKQHTINQDKFDEVSAQSL